MKWLVSFFGGDASDEAMAARFDAVNIGCAWVAVICFLGVGIGLASFCLIYVWSEMVAPAAGMDPMPHGLLVLRDCSIAAWILLPPVAAVMIILGGINEGIGAIYENRVDEQERAEATKWILNPPVYPNQNLEPSARRRRPNNSNVIDIEVRGGSIRRR